MRVCTCAVGFHGEYCNYTGSPCEKNPCKNGGSCLVTGGNFMCKCPPGTDGDYCEKDYRKDCSLKPCVNGGICDMQPSSVGYRCKCPAYHRGKNCEMLDPHYYGDYPSSSSKVCVDCNLRLCFQKSCLYFVF